jgi:hypothetical protein
MRMIPVLVAINIILWITIHTLNKKFVQFHRKGT